MSELFPNYTPRDVLKHSMSQIRRLVAAKADYLKEAQKQAEFASRGVVPRD